MGFLQWGSEHPSRLHSLQQQHLCLCTRVFWPQIFTAPAQKHPPLTAKIHDASLVPLQPLSAQPREAKDTQRAPEAIAEGPGGVWGSMCHLSSCSQGHHSPTPCAQPAGAMGAQMLCSFSACKFSSRALALPSCGLRASLLLAGDPWDTTMLSHIPLQAPTVMVLFQHYLL